jgi:2-polyprenyl-3-methyl-5-hydroxy-6-metoxy-1,4-benzoquinol methylase
MPHIPPELEETARLERVSRTGLFSAPLNVRTTEWSGRIFTRHLRGGRVLEVGPGDGVMTDLLRRVAGELEVLDGCPAVCEHVARLHPGIKVHRSLAEDFEPATGFDAIVMGHVLEHVADPSAVLRRAHGWLNAGGRVFASVPNALSVHRQAAVVLGLLRDEHDLSESDHQLGHRRVFDPASFRALFEDSGFRVDVFGGYWLKPLSNAQLESSWTPAMIDAFMALGERCPDIAAELYVVACAECR